MEAGNVGVYKNRGPNIDPNSRAICCKDLHHKNSLCMETAMWEPDSETSCSSSASRKASSIVVTSRGSKLGSCI